MRISTYRIALTLEQGRDKIEKEKRNRKIISFNPTLFPLV